MALVGVAGAARFRDPHVPSYFTLLAVLAGLPAVNGLAQACRGRRKLVAGIKSAAVAAIAIVAVT